LKELPANAASVYSGGADPLTAHDHWRSRAFEWTFLGLFALLLAMVTARHQMWEDELQAWLIVRDSSTLAELFHNLRYEGHPALWYLILYIPAHLSWNPIWMQVINFAIAVTTAWLILSARTLHWAFRVLATFSFFVFFQYGVVARSYMLTAMLLIAAVRCMVGERQHKELAIVFLALAIDTHFYAIPIAMVFAFQMLPIDKLKSRRDCGKLFRDHKFQAACAVLFASVLIAYFTIRPPADIYTKHGLEKHSVAYNVLWTESRAWQAFVPPDRLTDRMSWLRSDLYPFGPPAGFSLALFLLFAGALRTARARLIFLAASAFELVVMSLVYPPALWHFGLFFITFILASLVDAVPLTDRTGGMRLLHSIALVAAFLILGLQTVRAATRSREDWKGAYSYAKQTSDWLVQSGLDKEPMVFMPYRSGPAVIGYMQRPSAHYPACRCVGSFAVLKTGVDAERIVTENELEDLSGPSHLPVIVVSGSELPAETLRSLRVQELRTFSGSHEAKENYYVYQRLSQ
jgi:hypothetical protein